MGLAHLTVLRYHVLLCMLCPDHPHPEAPPVEFDERKEGPNYIPFFELQEAENKPNPSSSRPGSKLIRALNRELDWLESGSTPHRSGS